MNLDMTKGSPLKLITKFTLPLIIGNVFQQFYNMVDTVIVGRFVGVEALAAVGATGTIMFLIFGFMSGITTGFTVLTSQKYGAGDITGVKKSVGSAAILSVIITIFATICSIGGMRRLLLLLNTPSDIFEMSYEYIVIICAGMVCCVLYNMMSSLLRAVGNSVVPLVFLIISAVLNIFLDLLLIINYQMGVAGAAVATVVAQGVAGLACVLYVAKKVPLLCIKGEHLHLHGEFARTQMRIGVPMALQFSITAIGTLILQGALNMLGSIAIAAYTAASKAEQLLTQPFLAIGMTMATYSAQNYGIYDFKRIRQGTKISCMMTSVYAVIIAFAANKLIASIIRLFVTGDIDDIIVYGSTYIQVVSLFFIPLGLIFVFRNVMQGMGFG
ncbi:MAG TPA: MATE family efflux transporter, partial [Lachnospiraceae bacterium]|nr:MATE family efflux transporter [Lachnospiraceae bacterium]